MENYDSNVFIKASNFFPPLKSNILLIYYFCWRAQHRNREYNRPIYSRPMRLQILCMLVIISNTKIRRKTVNAIVNMPERNKHVYFFFYITNGNFNKVIVQFHEQDDSKIRSMSGYFGLCSATKRNGICRGFLNLRISFAVLKTSLTLMLNKGWVRTEWMIPKLQLYISDFAKLIHSKALK